MTYETLAYVIKMGGTISFFSVFLVAILYALWPNNRKKFQRAAALPLLDSDKPEAE